MAIVTSTIKGQIVIPAEIRKKFKILKGTRVNVYENGNKIIVEPLTENPVREGMGMLKTRGRILKALTADRKRFVACPFDSSTTHLIGRLCRPRIPAHSQSR
jgi:AbrB family looped-hinge helix DNA binding protein